MGALLGFPVRVHWTLPAAVVLLGAGTGKLLGALFVLVLAIGLFGSVLLHEVGHAVLARRFGVGVRGILLTPLGGMSFLEGVPHRAREEALIAVAGPVVSLVLAALFLAITWITGAGWDQSSPLAVLFAMNLVLGLFNLLPAFPMDGGRILRAALTPRLGLVDATRASAGVGRVLATVAIAYSLLYGQVLLGLIAVYVFFAGRLEERGVMTRDALAGLTAAQVMQTPVRSLAPGMGATEALDQVRAVEQKVFPVLWGDVVLGTITRPELQRLAQVTQDGGPLSLHIDRDVIRVDETTLVEDVLQAMVQARKGTAIVTSEGALSGVVTIDDMLDRVHQLRRPPPGGPHPNHP